MIKQRGEELKPGYQKTKFSTIKGKRLVNVTSLIKKEAMPGDVYYVEMPALNPNQCIIPDTMKLSFSFANGNTKSTFKNNLGRQLCNGHVIRFGGNIIYENTGEGLLETYKDLRKSSEERKYMIEYGVANENLRKLLSKDDSAVTQNRKEDVLMNKIYNRQKIKLGQILEDHGPYAPYDMNNDFQYQIRLSAASEILKPQNNQSVADYKLTDMNLEFETIESEELANQVKSEYEVGRALAYDYTTLLETLNWKKDSTRKNIAINIPRKSMKAIVLLCTKKNPDDSEEYVNAEITKVKVTIEGNPNAVYSDGLHRKEIYNEAKRFFGRSDDNYNVSCQDFYKDKSAVVIDLVDEETVVGSGRKLIGTQSGILLEGEKEATANDLECNVFVISDGLVTIANRTRSTIFRANRTRSTIFYNL